MVFEKQLTEQLRPKNLNECILLDRVKTSIGDGVVKQNLLFHGAPGSGKTSLMKLLVNDYDYKYINASEERGIDTVRETIVDYCSTYSVNGTDALKYVILDEFDGATDAFFKAFRAISERFPHVRYLATCNYINKLPDPIKSRFLLLDFDPKNTDEEEELYKKYVKRVKIISKRKVNLTWENEDVIYEFVKKNFPDFRKIVSKLQDFQTAGITEVTAENISKLNYTFSSLFDVAISNIDSKEVYKMVLSEYQNKVDDVFASFGSEFVEWLETEHPEHLEFTAAIVTSIVDYQFKKTQLIDPILAVLAMIYQIQSIIYGPNKKKV